MQERSSSIARTARVKQKPYIVAVVFGLIAMGVLVAVFAFLMSLISLPMGIEGFFSVVSMLAGCLISGVFIGKVMRANGLICGGKCGFLIFAVILLISFVSGGFTGEFFLLKMILCVVLGAIGGVIGVNSRMRI